VRLPQERCKELLVLLEHSWCAILIVTWLVRRSWIWHYTMAIESRRSSCTCFESRFRVGPAPRCGMQGMQGSLCGFELLSSCRLVAQRASRDT
jgi:hypothetical protein